MAESSYGTAWDLQQTDANRLESSVPRGLASDLDVILEAWNRTKKETGLVPLLPLLFTLKGKPYEIATGHFPMRPMFKLFNPARKTLWKTGRQVAKSTSQAYQGSAFSIVLPNFNTGFITPLYEQIRRFSTNYVRPAVNSCILRDYIREKFYRGQESVLQRSFPHNGSNMFFSFAYQDTERIRGLALDKIVVDECVRSGSLVAYADGSSRPVAACSPGDLIRSFTEAGEITEDTVVAVVNKGLRHVFRLNLFDGRHLDCTSNERLWTSSGWQYLVDLGASGVPAGDTPRRRVHAVDRCPLRSFSCEPRGQAGSLLPSQVRGVERPGNYTPEASGQPGIRRDKLLLQHGDISSLRIRTLPVLPCGPRVPAPQEDRDPGVVRSSDVALIGLLVHGRRGAQQWAGEPGDARVPQGASGAPHSEAARDGRGRPPASHESPGEDVLVHRTGHRRDARVPGEHPAVRRADHDVQVGGQAYPGGHLCVLRGGLPGPQQPGGLSAAALLRRGVPGQVRRVPQELPQRVVEAAGGTRKAELKSSREVLGKPRGVQEDQAGKHGQAHEGSGDTRTDAGGQESPESLAEAGVVSVEYLGVDEVWDIETARHHTFFANGIAVHNCQGINREFLPVIEATMDASPWRIQQYTGTPLSKANTMELLWQKSSMAEWAIKCSCGYTNVMGHEYDLLKCLGLDGLVCAKPGCNKPINTEEGYWLHKRKERRNIFTGYHAPQCIFPMHCRNPTKWFELLAKRDANFPAFMMENMGESWDVGTKLVSQKDLETAAKLPWKNTWADYIKNYNTRGYQLRVLTIDWSGGGSDEVSLTAMSALGLRVDGKIEVGWMKHYPHTTDWMEDAARVKTAFQQGGFHFVVHDFGGAGAGREQILLASGFPFDRLIPVTYVHTTGAKALMTFNKPQENNVRSSFSLDKTRSLITTCELIKQGWMLFPEYESCKDNLEDFLALTEDTLQTPRGSDIHLIGKIDGIPDDMAHSINIGTCAMFYRVQKWPDLGQIIRKYESLVLGELNPDKGAARILSGIE